MTYPLYDTIISEVKLDSRNWIWDAKFFIYNLPQVNKAVLSRLMEFLKNLMKHSSETGLTYEYIAKAFGPSLLRPHPKLVISASEEKTSNQAIFDRIIKEFIENQELLFVVISLSYSYRNIDSILDQRSPRHCLEKKWCLRLQMY